MSVSKQQLDEVRLVGANAAHDKDELDWVALLTSFAEQYDMQFNETLRWISRRTSLQVVCEIMGIVLSPSIASRYTERDLEILNSLGDVLWAHGCKVPRLMEHRRMEYVRKGRETMGFSLTREEYLRERAAGKSKNKIAKQQGISGPALFHWLNKWGLKDVAVEQKEIEQLLHHTTPPVELSTVEPSLSQSGSEVAGKGRLEDECQQSGASLSEEALCQTEQPGLEDNTAANADGTPADGAPGYVLYPRRKLHVVLKPTNDPEVPQYSKSPLVQTSRAEVCSSLEIAQVGHTASGNSVERGAQTEEPAALDCVATIHMPLLKEQGLSPLPEAISTKDLSRDEMMQMGLRLLQEAVGRAYGDLSELLGAEPAGHQIHQYVAHQVEKFTQKKG